MIVPVFSRIPGDFYVGTEHFWLACNDVTEHPWHNDYQILWSACRRCNLEAKTRLSLFGEKVPSLQFDAQNDIIRSCPPQLQIAGVGHQGRSEIAS
jgi:hypothetical protein